MATISSRQIRAARGLLNLSQKELAQKADLSVNSLNNIERDVGSPRVDSMRAIEDALQLEGIEFLEQDGVRLQGEVLQIEQIEGTELDKLFYEDCHKTFASATAARELLVMGKDNTRLQAYDLDQLLPYKRFEEFVIKNKISERALFLEGDTNFLATRNLYRWVPKSLFGEVPMAIYGHNVAIVLWGPPRRMVIIRNKGIAQSFRQQFEALWSMAKPVPDDVYRHHYEMKAKKIIDEARAAGRDLPDLDVLRA